MASFFKKLVKTTEKIATQVARNTQNFAEEMKVKVEKGVDKMFHHKKEKKIVEKELENQTISTEINSVAYMSPYSNYNNLENQYQNNFLKTNKYGYYNTQYDVVNYYTPLTLINQNPNEYLYQNYDINQEYVENMYPSFN